MLNFGEERERVTKKKALFKFTGYVLKHEGILCLTTAVTR